MRTSKFIFLFALLLPALALAQDTAGPGGPPDPPPPGVRTMHGPMGMQHGGPMQHEMGGGEMGRGGPRHEMGKWWENSELVKKLQLTDAQIKQLNQTFFDHRMKLIDYHAEMEKQDMKLQSLLDEDSPSEAQVGAQVDQVLAARSKLEREDTMMSLDLRKVLSVDQWRQLKAIRKEHGEHGPQGHAFFDDRGSGPEPHP
jgi:protein CpxP